MASHSGPDIIEDGLVLALDAANTKSYGGSGTTWSDLSGNGNDGTIDGATHNSDGYFAFDGSNDYVDIGNVLNQFPITISAWTKTNSTSESYNVDVVNKYTAASGNGYRLAFSSNGISGFYFKNNSNLSLIHI